MAGRPSPRRAAPPDLFPENSPLLSTPPGGRGNPRRRACAGWARGGACLEALEGGGVVRAVKRIDRSTLLPPRALSAPNPSTDAPLSALSPRGTKRGGEREGEGEGEGEGEHRGRGRGRTQRERERKAIARGRRNGINLARTAGAGAGVDLAGRNHDSFVAVHLVRRAARAAGAAPVVLGARHPRRLVERRECRLRKLLLPLSPPPPRPTALSRPGRAPGPRRSPHRRRSPPQAAHFVMSRSNGHTVGRAVGGKVGRGGGGVKRAAALTAISRGLGCGRAASGSRKEPASHISCSSTSPSRRLLAPRPAAVGRQQVRPPASEGRHGPLDVLSRARARASRVRLGWRRGGRQQQRLADLFFVRSARAYPPGRAIDARQQLRPAPRHLRRRVHKTLPPPAPPARASAQRAPGPREVRVATPPAGCLVPISDKSERVLRGLRGAAPWRRAWRAAPRARGARRPRGRSAQRCAKARRPAASAPAPAAPPSAGAPPTRPEAAAARPRPAPAPRRAITAPALRGTETARVGTGPLRYLAVRDGVQRRLVHERVQRRSGPDYCTGHRARHLAHLLRPRRVLPPRRPHAAAQPGPGAAIDHSAAQNGG